jgi:hypothetical protein
MTINTLCSGLDDETGVAAEIATAGRHLDGGDSVRFLRMREDSLNGSIAVDVAVTRILAHSAMRGVHCIACSGERQSFPAPAVMLG